MSKYKYSKTEQQINNVLNHQQKVLSSIVIPDRNEINDNISDSEEIIRNLGYVNFKNDLSNADSISCSKKVVAVPSWDELCLEAEMMVGTRCDLESLFTKEELQSNEVAIKMLNEEFNAIHRLDKLDVTICASAGLLGAAVDILLVGIPQKSADGLKGGPLSDYIRKLFDEKFSPEEIEKLANSKVSKVPYDAQDNRNTTEFVEGLSAYYHRLLSLGHDPVLGLIFGVFDILNGRMTTIDKTGKIVSQVMENYSDRKESDVFAAIAKQILHFKSDITTSMGLPVPLMSLFNLLQFGSIDDENQTIAEIVQGMYFEGYDFVHFCSMSIPVMIVEVVIRMGYYFKRIKEGYTTNESIPFSLDRDKHPKLATMLFIGHSASTSINAGKIYFTKNPMAINYPQWIAFSKYSYKQLKWVIQEKPVARDAYVTGKINEDLSEIFNEIDTIFDDFSKKYIFVD